MFSSKENGRRLSEVEVSGCTGETAGQSDPEMMWHSVGLCPACCVLGL